MLFKRLQKRTQRIVDRTEMLAKISEAQNGLTRTYGSNALKQTNQLVLKWMSEAGLDTKTDNIGNVRGVLYAAEPTDKTFVIGSHLDTVKNAGKYDGSLGLLIALELVEELRQTDNIPPFNIEVVGFCDEEGVRFTTTYLGSSVLSNSFKDEWLDLRDEEGISLADVIENNGGDPYRITKESYPPNTCLGYYEVHIEQGPVLEARNTPVGVVSCIAGQTRVKVTFKGKAGHAGTTPMHMRQDALCAAAHFISEVRNYAQQSGGSITATVGKLITSPNASNVIPGEVVCTLDLRSSDNTIMRNALKELKTIAHEYCKPEDIVLNWAVLQQNESVHCNAFLNALLKKAISNTDIDSIITLPSGAGHDAVALSGIMPVSMLFVQCKDGLSHHPDEYVKFTDICAALEVSVHFIKEFIHFYQTQEGDTEIDLVDAEALIASYF